MPLSKMKISKDVRPMKLSVAKLAMCIAAQKMQRQEEPYLFLGHTITAGIIKPYKLQFSFPIPTTLASMKTFLGNLTWMQPGLPITPGQLAVALIFSKPTFNDGS